VLVAFAGRYEMATGAAMTAALLALSMAGGGRRSSEHAAALAETSSIAWTAKHPRSLVMAPDA
jgi:hypothetical protein